jgi:PAS domain S-box-containing protein
VLLKNREVSFMGKKTLYAFIISFFLLIAVIILNRFSFSAMRNYSEQVDHTRLVISVFQSISNHFKSAQIYTPTYATGPDKDFYALYRREAESIRREIEQLKQLVRDNPEQAKRADSLNNLVTAEIDVLLTRNIAEIISSGERWRLKNILQCHELINKGIAKEEVVLIDRKASLTKSTAVTNVLTTSFGVIAIGIIIFTFISHFFLSKRRKWLEGFLESILDTSQNGIVHYKAIREKGKILDFRLEFVNQAVDRLLGINSKNITGKKLSEFPSFVRDSDVFEKYITVVETAEPMTFETLYKKEPIEKWFLVSLAKLDDGVIASFHDISQIKKYEAELKENIKDLERSNSELEQYAYVASHDLQEPLRKIRSFGSYLQDTQAKKMDEKGQMQLGKIMSSAERMSVLIKDILTFSSLKKEDALTQVDLDEALKTVLQDLDLLITQKKATIESEPLPVVEAIPLQMTQLFFNLINNSLKFASEDRRLLIRISCRLMEEQEKEKHSSFLKNTRYYKITFTDNGIGFGSEYAEQIFGLFKRLNDKQFYPGSGIGLALCKKVVDNHHGEIEAEGKEGAGATFNVYLPEKQG